MKTTIWHFAMYVIATIVMFVFALHLTSCESKSGRAVRMEEDSLRVCRQIEGVVNPKFDNVSEVMSYKDELNTTEYEDSVFKQMSPQLVYQIATIVVNRDGFATKTSIVKEYERGKDIYNSLPKDIPDSIVHPSKVDGEIASQITTKDTTIGGKKAHIKTVTTYEQRLYDYRCRQR